MNAEATEPDSRQLSLFRDLGRIVVAARGSEDALRALVERMSAFFGPDRLSVWLLDEKSQDLRLVLFGNQASKRALRLGEGVAGRVAQLGETLLVERAQGDVRSKDSTPAGAGSLLGVPIKGRERVLGVIELGGRLSGPGEAGETRAGTLEVLADYLAIAIENARLGILDHCTGFYNAGHLNHVLDTEISRSQRFRHEFSVVFMDLDHLREVNETCGHLVGSKLMAMVGELVRSRLRQADSAFRYGGDEFVLVLPGATKPNAVAMVRRLAEALNAAEFDLGEGRRSRLTASYGIASFPADGSTGQDLLRVADETMSRVKNTTRNGIAVAGEELRPLPER